MEDRKEYAYIELYKKLRDEIIAGAYRFGDKLPSKRVTADKTGCSVITVEHAYEILCDEGYADSRERSGYFVSYKESDGFSSPSVRDKGIEHVTPERSDETDTVFPFSVLAKTARYVLSVYGKDIMVKSANNGCEELRRAIAAYLLRGRGISVRPEQIVIGSGAEYLYGIIVQMLGRDKIFGTEDPSYEKIQSVYESSGVRCEPLKLGEHGIISRELENSRADVLHITPYRSYPSGITATAAKKREYLRWAHGGDRYLIEDDFESEFSVSTKVEDTVFSLDDSGRVIYLNTFSKTISPSVRIGYMVLPERLIPLYDEKVGFYSCTVPAFEQYIIAELLKNGDFERHINRVRRAKRRMIAEKSK